MIDLLWLKAIIYRLLRMVIVFISSYIVLNNTDTALNIMSVDVIAATILYYWYDKYWFTMEAFFRKQWMKYKYRKLNNKVDT